MSLMVLVAEDSPVIRKMLEALLTRDGHTVIIVSNGVEAVSAAEADPFDLILMDLRMPEMDGLEATRLIRAAAGHQPLIVALSGDDDPDTAAQCSAAGMDGNLSKPIAMGDLTRILERAASPDK